jgi:hypothetical protein
MLTKNRTLVNLNPDPQLLRSAAYPTLVPPDSSPGARKIPRQSKDAVDNRANRNVYYFRGVHSVIAANKRLSWIARGTLVY